MKHKLNKTTRKFSLRYRVALTFFLLGWTVSMIMGGILYWLTITLEEQLIEDTLSTELEDYMERYATDPTIPPPSSTHIQGYVASNKNPDSLPVELQYLPLGLSHIIIGDSGYFVELRKNSTTSFLVVYSDQLIMQRENQYLGFILLGVTVITLLSSVLGFWLASKVILPVTRLARQVSEIGDNFQPLSLAADYPQDEVGRLAQAFEDYHHRLMKFIERERAFTGDVSHELRTPLTIIDGASEILLSGTTLSDAHRKGVLRISRASHQIIRLTSALLTLAREKPGKDDPFCAVNEVLSNVVAKHRYLVQHKSVEIYLDINSELLILADPELLYVVLANLIRNAFSYTNTGNVHIQLVDNRVVIEDTGSGMNEDQLLNMFNRCYSNNRAIGGHGIGLSLVWRICQYYGWDLSVRSREQQGTAIELLLYSPSQT